MRIRTLKLPNGNLVFNRPIQLEYALYLYAVWTHDAGPCTP